MPDWTAVLQTEHLARQLEWWHPETRRFAEMTPKTHGTLPKSLDEYVVALDCFVLKTNAMAYFAPTEASVVSWWKVFAEDRAVKTRVYADHRVAKRLGADPWQNGLGCLSATHHFPLAV